MLGHLVTLGESGVKSLDDFADLASDELREILGVTTLNEEQANETIMAARAHWFDDEPSEEPHEEPHEDTGHEKAEHGDSAEDAPAKKIAKEVADDVGEKDAD
jgi:N utilization substance protein A